MPPHGRAQIWSPGNLLRYGGRRRDGSVARVPWDERSVQDEAPVLQSDGLAGRVSGRGDHRHSLSGVRSRKDLQAAWHGVYRLRSGVSAQIWEDVQRLRLRKRNFHRAALYASWRFRTFRRDRFHSIWYVKICPLPPSRRSRGRQPPDQWRESSRDAQSSGHRNALFLEFRGIPEHRIRPRMVHRYLSRSQNDRPRRQHQRFLCTDDTASRSECSDCRAF